MTFKINIKFKINFNPMKILKATLPRDKRGIEVLCISLIWVET